MNRKNAEIFGDGKGISVIAAVSVRKRFMSFLQKGLYFNECLLVGYINSVLIERIVSQWVFPFVSIVAHPKTFSLSSLRAVEYLAAKGHHFRSLTEILEKYEI